MTTRLGLDRFLHVRVVRAMADAFTQAEAFALSRYPSAFVCITAFFGGSSSPAPLHRVLDSILSWRVPHIKTALMTQDNASLAALSVALGAERLTRWATVSGRELQVVTPPTRVHNVLLPWYHRTLMGAEAGRFALFGYLECDIEMRWEHVVAWARDEELLRHAPEPVPGLPWRRGFYRWYERYYRGPEGPAYAHVASDQSSAHQVREGGAAGQEADHPLSDVAERFLADGNPCRPEHGLSAARCRVEVGGATFVGLPLPYSGSWLMGARRLERLVESAHWKPNRRGNLPDVLWGPRETAASGDAFLNFTYRSEARASTHCMNGLLVPYRKDAARGEQLAAEAGLQHLVQRFPLETPVSSCLEGGGWSSGRGTWEQLHDKSVQHNFSGRPCEQCTLLRRGWRSPAAKRNDGWSGLHSRWRTST